MKLRRPSFLIAAGIAMVFAGLVYDIIFAGIPYQDPSPQLQAAFEADAHFAKRLMDVGGFVTFLGFIVAIVRSAIRCIRRQFGSAPTETRSI
jgi:hypothetical protein